MSDFDGLFPATDLVLNQTDSRPNKRFTAFEPHAVMLFPASLDAPLPQNHVSRFMADIAETQLDLGKFYASSTLSTHWQSKLGIDSR